MTNICRICKNVSRHIFDAILDSKTIQVCVGCRGLFRDLPKSTPPPLPTQRKKRLPVERKKRLPVEKPTAPPNSLEDSPVETKQLNREQDFADLQSPEPVFLSDGEVPKIVRKSRTVKKKINEYKI